MTFDLTSPASVPPRICTISACELYRYELANLWDRDRPFDVHCLCNPSTATADDDDQTLRKVIGFADHYGRGGWAIVNPYAYRSRHPKALLTVADPVGPANRTFVERWMRAAWFSGGRVIVGWGRALPKPLRNKARDEVCASAREIGCDLWCYGLTKDGQPKHPLTLAYTTPLVRFVP